MKLTTHPTKHKISIYLFNLKKKKSIKQLKIKLKAFDKH